MTPPQLPMTLTVALTYEALSASPCDLEHLPLPSEFRPHWPSCCSDSASYHLQCLLTFAVPSLPGMFFHLHNLHGQLFVIHISAQLSLLRDPDPKSLGHSPSLSFIFFLVHIPSATVFIYLFFFFLFMPLFIYHLIPLLGLPVALNNFFLSSKKKYSKYIYETKFRHRRI